jgi:GNAT superfamily N-acetyltransferase
VVLASVWPFRRGPRRSPASCRAAGPADAPAIIALTRAFCAEEGTGPSRLGAADLEAHAFGPQGFCRIVVAEAGGRLIGYALAYPGFDAISATTGLYLADLYVLPEARRQGVGRALMVAVAASCREGGGRWLTWNTLTSNATARGFYARIGAREHPLQTLSLDTAGLDRLIRRG